MNLIDKITPRETEIMQILNEAERKISAIIGKTVIIGKYDIIHHVIINPLITPDKIITIASEITQVPISSIIGKSKEIKMVFIRYGCFAEIKKRFNISTKQIGKHFGNRDHSTILTGLKEHENLYNQNYKDYRQFYDSLVQAIENYLISQRINNN